MASQFNTPLAERMRPTQLEDLIGQDHLTGDDGVIRKIIQTGSVPSMVFWGPPGTGKTTLAQLIATQVNRPFYQLSAISAGVKEVREVIRNAQLQGNAILFIDEIHRFSKSQQDALLGAVEKGIITLIGATTENPSFEVIPALLSRCQVYVLESLGKQSLIALLERAIAKDEWLQTKDIELKETDALLRISGGDARKLLNLFEIVLSSNPGKIVQLTNAMVTSLSQQQMAKYDKSGEQHYDIISAFIKSIRGSDPNAAVYWLARMIEGGEDPKFIARRLVISASEDIGNANPTALVLATNCFEAVKMIGYPECELILAQATTYLAASPKSNASYQAIKAAKAAVRKSGDLPVPLHLRNAPTKLMKELDYGKDYQYAHDYQGNFVLQDYLPDEISGSLFYDPGDNARENEMRKRLAFLWGGKYKY